MRWGVRSMGANYQPASRAAAPAKATTVDDLGAAAPAKATTVDDLWAEISALWARVVAAETKAGVTPKSTYVPTAEERKARQVMHALITGGPQAARAAEMEELNSGLWRKAGFATEAEYLCALMAAEVMTPARPPRRPMPGPGRETELAVARRLALSAEDLDLADRTEVLRRPRPAAAPIAPVAARRAGPEPQQDPGGRYGLTEADLALADETTELSLVRRR